MKSLGRMSSLPLVPPSRERQLSPNVFFITEVVLVCKSPLFADNTWKGVGLQFRKVVGIQPNFYVCCPVDASKSSLLSMMRAVIMDYLAYSLCLFFSFPQNQEPKYSKT